MDSTTAATMKDLILVLYYRLKSRDPSLKRKDLLPSDLRTTTRSISSLACTPDHVLQDVHHEINAAIIAAREQHNGSLPVNSLPPELLAKIFQENVKFDNWGRGDIRAKLSMVCRRWRLLLLNTPSLWTRWVLSHQGAKYFNWVRGLSKPLGLEITYSESWKGWEMWGAIYKEIHRWQDMKITFFNRPKHPNWPKLGNAVVPKLRKLFLRATDLSPLDLFDPNDPCNLEELTLEETTVVWEGVNLQRLRYLRICNILSMGPSEVQLLRILERSPQLEYLFLGDVTTSHESTALSMPNEPVCLPHLSTLRLSGVDYNSDLIVRMMRFPQCKNVVLEGIHLDIADPNSASSLAHLIHVIGNIMKVNQVTLGVTKDELMVSAFGGMALNVTFRTRADPELGLTWFIDATSAALDASPSVHMKFSSNFSYDYTMQIISSLGRLRGITGLDFEEGRPEDDECHPLDCLDNLGDQIRCTFPRLDSLLCCVDTASELETLRKVVLRRNRTISSQEGAEISPLRTVIVEHYEDWDLEGRCDAEFDAVQALIPGGDLIINYVRWRAETDTLEESE